MSVILCFIFQGVSFYNREREDFTAFVGDAGEITAFFHKKTQSAWKLRRNQDYIFSKYFHRSGCLFLRVVEAFSFSVFDGKVSGGADHQNVFPILEDFFSHYFDILFAIPIEGIKEGIAVFKFCPHDRIAVNGRILRCSGA